MSAERSLSAGVIALIQAKEIRPVLFIRAEFPSGTKRYWTGEGDIDYDIIISPETWEGVGDVIGFESFDEDIDTAAKGLAARINGLSTEFADDLLNSDYQGGEVVIYLGFWNPEETGIAALDDPLWRGTLDSDESTVDGEKSSIVIRGEHRLRDILRKREFRYTDQDQQLLYPGEGDTGMNKIEQIQDTSIPWGRTQA
jgi:hypothetical protein